MPRAPGRAFRWLLLALFAPAGVLTGHCLAYAVAIPDPEARATMLMDTGHMWWGLATPAAALLAVAGILLICVRRIRRIEVDGARKLVTPETCGWLAPRLAVTQLAAFVGIEVLERLAVGHPLDDLVEHGILGHGVVAQLLASTLLTAGVWWLALTVQRLGGAIIRPWPVPARELRSPVEHPRFHVRTRPAGPVGARAPPLPS